MPYQKLPSELWDHIVDFCDHEAECALSKVNHRLADLINDRHECTIERCEKKGIVLPPHDIMHLAFHREDLPLDIEKIGRWNPFGCSLTATPSKVKGMDEEKDDKGENRFSSHKDANGRTVRGKVEYTVDFEEIGIPHWMVDGIRPTIHASCILRRQSPLHAHVSCVLSMCRQDHSRREQLASAIGTLVEGEDEQLVEVLIEPAARRHGHSCVAGADKLIVSVNASCDVVVSDFHIEIRLPEKVPPSFSDWLVEGRALREAVTVPDPDPHFFGL